MYMKFFQAKFSLPFFLSFSATGADECLILFGDSDGCINILVINSVGECLRSVPDCLEMF